MSTTNPTVGDLLAGKRRRLEQLLERRRTVGSAWAERISPMSSPRSALRARSTAESMRPFVSAGTLSPHSFTFFSTS